MAKALAASGQQRSAHWPNRPGYGTKGQPVTLYTNYLSLTSVGKPLFRYDVSIAPDGNRAPAGKKARQIVRLLLEEHFSQNLAQIATDYRSNLIACVKLQESDKQDYDVRYKDENDEEYPENPRVFKVTCKHTGHLNPADLVNYLTSTNASAMLDSKPELIQALNVIMGHHPKTEQSIASVGANKHFAVRGNDVERLTLGGGLEVLRGFFISVRTAAARVLLNVQVKYLACYEEGPLGGVIASWAETNRWNTYRLEAFLKRLRVRVTHIQRKTSSGKPRPRIKPISGLATPRDGAGSPNPPKVSHHGAGPEDVQFFVAAPGSQPAQPTATASKGKKGKTPPKAGPAQEGRYVTVAQFFLNGKRYPGF